MSTSVIESGKKRVNVSLSARHIRKLVALGAHKYPDSLRTDGLIIAEAIDLLYDDFQRKQRRRRLRIA